MSKRQVVVQKNTSAMNWLEWSRCFLCLAAVIATDVKKQDLTEWMYQDDAASDESIEPEDLRFYQAVSNRSPPTPFPNNLGNITWAKYITKNYYGSYLVVPSTNALPVRLPDNKRHYYFGFGNPNYSYRTCSNNTESDCRFLDHCARPEYLRSFDTFLANACPIGKDYIGVCCPIVKTTSTSTTSTTSTTTTVQPFLSTTTKPSKAATVSSNVKRCGVHCCKVTDKIVGGKPADPREWPWMAAILRDGADRFCGGVLITDQHVLTVAHCVFSFQPADLTVRLGEYDFRVRDNTERDYSVENFVMHENYDRRKLHNDIAILKLNKKVVFTPDVRPICLPDKRLQIENQNAYVIGWGVTSPTSYSSDILLEVLLPIRKQKYCKEKYDAYRISITDAQLCAGGIAGRDACQGDSGGPLMIQNPRNLLWNVVGLVSFGKGCGEQDKPGVYTRIASHDTWIRDKVFSL